MSKDKKETSWTKGFILLWQGQLVSTLGDAAYSIALGFWVLQVTGSTALMGTLMAASALSGILVSPFAGVWIERLNRKVLLIWMDLIRGISMLLITFAAFTNHLSVWMVFVAGILLSVCGAVFRPGVNSSVPDLVPVSRLTNANSILSIASTGSNMLGNIVGGYLFQLLGAPLLFLFNGVSYFFSGSSLAFVKLPRIQKETGQDFFKEMKEGFTYIWKQHGLRYLLMITALMNFFSFVGIVLFLPYFQKTAYLGAGRYGVAMACFMGGAMIGYVIFSIVTIPSPRRLPFFIVSNIICNMSLVIALNQRIFGIMLPFIILGGIFNSIINVLLLSTVQATTPADMRGKVMAFMNMSTQSLTPFAMAFGGILATFFPIRSIITVTFSLIVIIVTPFTFVKSFGQYLSYTDKEVIAE